jgi:hypothetical protein
MKEPVLSATGAAPDYFVLRALYLPTWGRPVAVRIEKRAGDVVYRSVMLSGSGGYDPGKIKKTTTRHLSKAEFETFLRELENSGFWALAPHDDVLGLDGAQLIIEAVKDGRYSLVERWTPEHQSSERKLSGVVAMVTRLMQEAGFWQKQ